MATLRSLLSRLGTGARQRAVRLSRSMYGRTAYCWVPTMVAALLVPYLPRQVLDWDEPATWDASTRSIGDLFALVGNIDGVLLPYYLFMHYWVAVFGDSEVALRAPSMLAVIAAVSVATLLGRRLFSARVGLVAGLLLAVVPAVSRYGQEARPYGIALLLSVLATLLLFRALDRPTRARFVGYGVNVALLGLFQLFGLLLLLAHAVIVVDRCRRLRAARAVTGVQPPLLPEPVEATPKTVGRRWSVATALGVLPSLPLFLLGFAQREAQLDWLPEPTWESVQTFPNELFWSPLLGWFVIGVALLARHPRRDLVGYLGVMALLPPVVLYLLGLFTAAWVPRYVLFSLVAWCLLAAVATARSAVRSVVLVGLVAVLSISSHVLIREPGSVGEVFSDGEHTAAYQVADHRTAMAILAKNVRPGDGMVFEPESAWSLRSIVKYYLAPGKRPHDVLMTRTPRQNDTFEATECADPRRCLSSVDRVWIYRVGEHHSTLDYFPGPIPVALRADFQLGNHWSVPGGTLEIFLRKP